MEEGDGKSLVITGPGSVSEFHALHLSHPQLQCLGLGGAGMVLAQADGSSSTSGAPALIPGNSRCNTGPSPGASTSLSRFRRSPFALWWAHPLALALEKRRKDPPKTPGPQLKFLCCSKLNWTHWSWLCRVPSSLGGMNWWKRKWQWLPSKGVQSTDINEGNVFCILPPAGLWAEFLSISYSPKCGLIPTVSVNCVF